MQAPTLLILAAGMGSRYGGLKQIDKIGPSGEAIIDYSIYDAIRAGFGKVVFVIRRELEQDFRDFFEEKLKGLIEMEFVYQELENVPAGVHISPERKKPWGTGHAILVAAEKIKEPFVAINADDFYGEGAYKAVADYFKVNQNASDHCMVGYKLGMTLSDYGTVSRGVCKSDESDFLKNITEVTNIEKKNGETGYQQKSGEWTKLTGDEIVSMNIWGFYPGIFDIFKKGFEKFIANAKDDPKAEYYIAWPLMDMIDSGRGRIRILSTGDRWFGVTYREDKGSAVERINKLIELGRYPANLWKV
ncbi:MAG: NDP-sugar synthase [Bacteroidales bacterium]